MSNDISFTYVEKKNCYYTFRYIIYYYHLAYTHSVYPSHYPEWSNITLHYITLHYITLHYITLLWYFATCTVLSDLQCLSNDRPCSPEWATCYNVHAVSRKGMRIKGIINTGLVPHMSHAHLLLLHGSECNGQHRTYTHMHEHAHTWTHVCTWGCCHKDTCTPTLTAQADVHTALTIETSQLACSALKSSNCSEGKWVHHACQHQVHECLHVCILHTYHIWWDTTYSSPQPLYFCVCLVIWHVSFATLRVHDSTVKIYNIRYKDMWVYNSIF